MAEEQKANQTEETQETSEKKGKATETEDFFHKLYLFGIGLQKDIEETVGKLIEKGQVRAGEKEKVVDDIVKKVRERGDVVEGRLEEFINKTLGSMNLVTRDKYEALEKRVAELEQKIQELHPENDESPEQ